MVSAPSAVHKSILHAIMVHLIIILGSIPVPETMLAFQTMPAESIMEQSVVVVPDLAVTMCTGGMAGEPLWLMECAFLQSDCDVMQKLNAYVQDIPSLLVIGKLLIKQAQWYCSLGSNSSIAPHLRSSTLMTQKEWTADHRPNKLDWVVVDGHTWFTLSSVEIHVWTRQHGMSRIDLGHMDGDGYTYGTLYPTFALGDVNHAFHRGLELLKQEALLELKTVNTSQELFDGMAAWSPPSCPLNPMLLTALLSYGAWTTAYR
ncbi:hypothetical protein EDC04DRAFT_2895317 [Pisolithus marmoratus]|nr:hypothetical protein EDC04DRAFT_2895317 [Pisolithus marmoratus]